MRVYLVGGAVRDQLLSLPVKDRDWVVIGQTPERMLEQGYLAVGKDFPVFLHPDTKEEYALARTERKTGHGYTGFDCFFSPDVTLGEDLKRRDLTINAMALSEHGELIDPYGGAQDLNDRVLRHVSDAFLEDPLRVLRVARFAARFAHLGFTVAPETLSLMQQMSEMGELTHLTAERVWQEFERALSSDHPDVFLSILRACGALSIVLPEIDALFGVPQPERWHPEIDTGVHTLLVLSEAARLSTSNPVRFAATLHDLGKALTPPEEWPSHKRHTHTGLKPIRELCERLKVPNEYKTLALLVCEYHTNIHDAQTLRAKTLLKIFDKTDAWRKPNRFRDLLICCQADHQGRTGFETQPYPQKAYCEAAYQAAAAIDVQKIVASGLKGTAIREALNQERTAAIQFVKDNDTSAC